MNKYRIKHALKVLGCLTVIYGSPMILTIPSPNGFCWQTVGQFSLTMIVLSFGIYMLYAVIFEGK